jgi:acid phosphatase (class A)
MRRIFSLATIMLALVLPGLAWGVPYFDAATIPPTLLTPPPAVHSERWNRDVAEIIKRQKAPDKEAVTAASAERDLKPDMLVLPVEASFTRDQFPALYTLLDRTAETTLGVSRQAKDYWHTKRPYVMDSRIKALIEAHDNPAYPSGHTSSSYVLAHVMGLLIPDKRDAFTRRAREIAEHRVLVGMHYPHDLEGGRELALLIVGGLLQSADFEKDFAAAKAELSKQ